MSAPDSPPLTPPTVPGVVPHPHQGIEPRAGWSLGLAVLGLCVPLLGIAGIVLGIVALRRVIGREGRKGKTLAIAGIVIGAISLIVSFFNAMMFWSMFSMSQQLPAMVAAERLTTLHDHARSYAVAQDGYPSHIALLAADPNLRTPVHRRLNPGGDPPLPGEVVVGSFDFADWDESAAVEESLRAAIATTDLTRPTYEFGGITFVRLPAPTGDSSIVFLYRPNPRRGDVQVLMDSGLPTMIDEDQWSELWEFDAKARAEAQLPMIDPPAWPFGDEP